MHNVSVDQVVEELKAILKLLTEQSREDEIDVRLRVRRTSFEVKFGDPGYDSEHSGYWGASVIQRGDTEEDLTRHAEAMIEQALDHQAEMQLRYG